MSQVLSTDGVSFSKGKCAKRITKKVASAIFNEKFYKKLIDKLNKTSYYKYID
ncbi:hypothetical protein [Clostridium folliculivorans]|uniref:Uncharacterized protein n=1 Tax=Clostridium folliculivorans TaxID=2886038 RepID=A0A9W6DBU0_9CLOT|nr:hypothetical protein [Clostridium folliculivorans]GKU26311.1 hypothetical protein CFOLD11_31380 [Clostridium folliculivorans]GKU32134.1 hypothetical protein CFB3_42420 [Clostridium folliculivorans]